MFVHSLWSVEQDFLINQKVKIIEFQTIVILKTMLYLSLLNRVCGVGSWVAWVVWVAWVTCVHKILAWVMWVAWVEILKWVTWVHRILAWVAWIEILAWVRIGAPVSCYLIILYRKHYVFYRALYNCTNRIHQALQHTLFRIFLIQMKPVCDAFLDLLSDLFSLFFF